MVGTGATTRKNNYGAKQKKELKFTPKLPATPTAAK
jgi:hypothetical protein